MRAHRSTVLFGVLAVGLVLTQQACTREAPQPGSLAASGAASGAADATSGAGTAPAGKDATSGAGTAPAGKDTTSGGGEAAATGIAADPILAGKRQVVIKPIQVVESIVAVDARGRLNLTDGEAEHGLFVLTPVGDKYLIKTAKAGAGGEPSCLGVKTNGSDSLTVEAAACDVRRAGQLFTIARQKNKDQNGRPTYAISNRSAYLQVSERSGLIAEELGDAPLRTTYAFVDNGRSTLPVLG